MSDSREGSSGLGSPTVRKLGANGLPRRRNGKQQACEPCRKAKIACDHSLPVCERCRRRKVSDRCVYVDAPMTKGLDGSGVVFERQSAGPRPASGGRKGSKRDDVDGSERRESSGAGHANGGGERREEDYGNAKPVPESGPFIKSGGFFGERFVFPYVCWFCAAIAWLVVASELVIGVGFNPVLGGGMRIG